MNLIKCILLITATLATTNLMAHQQSFLTESQQKAVWVDFKSANYDINFDVTTKKAYAISMITFEVTEEGYPVIDFVEPASEVYINNEPVDHSEITLPNGKSKVKFINKKLKPGIHTALITTPITTNVKFKNNSVESIFSYLDMRDRYFLERYLPSNFEFDNYKMTFNVSINGTDKPHRIFSNGDLTEISENKFSISYPEHFTSSSLFFHLGARKRFKVLEKSYKSIDGRDIPITIYTTQKKFKDEKFLINNFYGRLVGGTLGVGLLPQLEKSYGPWPHKQLVLFVKNKLKGGMEYMGAAETSYGAFKHELIHNYFGRSVLPVDGNAGWIDEAIASWNDYKVIIKAQRQLYVLKKNWNKKNTNHHFKVKFYESKLSTEGLVHDEDDHFQRHTNKKSYRQGRYLLAYLDYLIQKDSRGEKCMKDFLRTFFEKHKMRKIHSNTFQDDIEEYSGLNFTAIFNKYIYKN